MKFKRLGGDIDWLAFGGSWISKRLNNGEWDFWFVIELVNLYDACGEQTCKEVGRYQVTISAVSPTAAGEAKVKEALDNLGVDLKHLTITDEMRVDALYQHGVYAVLKTLTGNNARKLLKALRAEAKVMDSLLGFYMDGPKNPIGHTGWDLIRGDLSLETAQKNREKFVKSSPT